MTVILCIESGDYSPPGRRFGICNFSYTRDCVIQMYGLCKCINNFIMASVICTSGVVIIIGTAFRLALQWSHMSVKASQNHQQLDCFFLNHLFKLTVVKYQNSSLPILCEVNMPVTGPSNAKNVSMWWRHHSGSRQCLEKERVIVQISTNLNLYSMDKS